MAATERRDSNYSQDRHCPYCGREITNEAAMCRRCWHERYERAPGRGADPLHHEPVRTSHFGEPVRMAGPVGPVRFENKPDERGLRNVPDYLKIAGINWEPHDECGVRTEE